MKSAIQKMGAKLLRTKHLPDRFGGYGLNGGMPDIGPCSRFNCWPVNT